jgi:DNA-binding Lrp family transcriptional regulator
MSEALLEVSASVSDPVNHSILEISEDQLTGFRRDPIGDISRLSGISSDEVILRIRTMLKAGTIRRVRQTLLATNLAQGALIAWKVPEEKLQAAFDFLLANDPFTGHIVIRSAETEGKGTEYRLWTTLKVPSQFPIDQHCEILKEKIGAEAYRPMPALRAFVLGVGHMRRRGLKPGSKTEELADSMQPAIVELTDDEWRVLLALKREFTADEVNGDMWSGRAAEAGVSLDRFFEVGDELNRRGVIGRFSTFLEHVKPVHGEQVTQFNGLFQWAVPPGKEIEAGREIGRFHCLTHCYWRDGGEELNGVNIMAVAHARDKETVLAHKAAIDEHLAASRYPVSYSNVFWGTRSEVRPSEISPAVYQDWIAKFGN